mmetsp:Transcript_19099/g.40260  ORF Transcript_19099/g.40260 Transcript_19099/m.40260 type:complete len:247 (-) Transcript_19099:131-871(-)
MFELLCRLAPLPSWTLVDPVHEMIVGTVFGSSHRVLLSHEEFFHVSRVIPSFGGPGGGGIVAHYEGNLGMAIIVGLVEFGTIVEDADALMDALFGVFGGCGIVGGPILQYGEYGPLHGVSLRRFLGTIVNIVRRLRVGALLVNPLSFPFLLYEFQRSFVVPRQDCRIVLSSQFQIPFFLAANVAHGIGNDVLFTAQSTQQAAAGIVAIVFSRLGIVLTVKIRIAGSTIVKHSKHGDSHQAKYCERK